MNNENPNMVDAKTVAPFGLGPQDRPLHSSEVLLKDPKTGETEPTVTMVFPRRVMLQTQEGHRVGFDAGIQEVPQHLADHNWLRLNGVTPYDSPLAKAAVANAKSIEEAEADLAAATANLAAAKAKAARTAPVVVKPSAPGKVVEDAPDEVDLDSMTKAALVAHAADVHDLELDPTAKKANLIAAITEAQQAK